jgi:hypothetical protein
MDDVRRLASRLMGCDVASIEAFALAMRLQPGAVMVRRQDGRLSAVVATLLLRQAAESQLLAGRFDGLSPSEDVLTTGDERPAIYYIWGVVADTMRARWAAVELSRRLRHESLGDLIGYMTAATPAGRRGAIQHLGFRPVGAGPESLLISQPVVERRAA